MQTMNFQGEFEHLDWEEVRKKIYSCTEKDVLSALHNPKRSMQDFAALLSPAAQPFLETMAEMSHQLTQKRFGRTVQLYAPMYLSNECANICTYCGYSFTNKIRRRTLNTQEILQEAEAIKKQGFDHILLVTGESSHTVHTEYFVQAVESIRHLFSSIAIEVQPLETAEYKALHDAGVHSVLVYQETYHREVYKDYHPKGKKSNFFYRLNTPDRIGKSGMHKIGLGVLLGLEDWRTDSLFCAMHLRYLQRKYWQCRFSLSFPRIRPAEGVSAEKFLLKDRDLVQLICAYRLLDEDLELSLSTRESESFRDCVFPLGITSMSAGSKTNPGGYSVEPESLEQFSISDERSPEHLAKMISQKGYEPVWKDWDRTFFAE